MLAKIDTRQQVFQSLDNARDGGYSDFLASATDEEVAHDLNRCDSELNHADFNTIIAAVRDWRTK